MSKVSAGKIVTIHYKLSLDDGRVVDSSEGGAPLDYLHGSGNIVPGLENGLEGRAVGDVLKVAVAPADGYGERVEDAVQQVPRQAFPADAELREGISFQALDEHENPMIGTITAMTADLVTVDFNHPLAGMNLNFEVSIGGVRDATAQEREHGHAHGAHGHDH